MAKTGITRNPGESEEDFKRRYKREYMRAYYHAKQSRPRKPRAPKPPVPGRIRGKYNIVRREGEDEREFQKRADRERKRIKRAVAKGADPDVSGEVLVKTPRKGLDISQEEWEALLQQPGESDEEWARRNAKARTDRYRARDPEKLRARGRAWYYAHPEYERERRLRYSKSDAGKATARRFFERNREARLAKLIEWGRDNPERVAESRQRWYDNNRVRRNFYSSKWRAQVRIATPLWADEEIIMGFYEEAAVAGDVTGVPHHVDHIVPLQGKLVCGLHTQRNLRVIPASDNVKKRAKLDTELLEELWHAERHLFPLPDDQV